MSITLFKASEFRTEITEIKATRVTEKSYYDLGWDKKEQRNAMAGGDFAIFENKEDAIKWKRNRLLSEKRIAYERIASVGRRIDEFNEKYPEAAM